MRATKGKIPCSALKLFDKIGSFWCLQFLQIIAWPKCIIRKSNLCLKSVSRGRLSSYVNTLDVISELTIKLHTYSSWLYRIFVLQKGCVRRVIGMHVSKSKIISHRIIKPDICLLKYHQSSSERILISSLYSLF